MAVRAVNRKTAEEMISEYEAEVIRLKVELGKAEAGLKALKDLQARSSGEPVAPVPGAPKQRIRRGDLKATVLSLLKERGTLGLNAAIAADITMQRGEPVDRNSVSSLLSRLMNDGIVDRIDNVYKLVGIKDASEADRVH